MIYDFIFIVLVYKNTTDLYEFLDSFSIPNAKIIVVNSFYDDETKATFSKLANKYNTDFLNIPNKGYGYGNNYGCKYAMENYKFKYIVISNADVIIKNLDISVLKNKENFIIAPDIRTLKGKRQNPFLLKHNVLLDKIKYHSFVKYNKNVILLSSIYARLVRELFHLLYKIGVKIKQIYAPHGSFIIIGVNAIEKIFPIFNEDIFLFCEEEHLGMLAKNIELKILYDPRIVILHKEDGSISLTNFNQFDIARSSYIKFYNFWY
jgi:hypothetical protein